MRPQLSFNQRARRILGWSLIVGVVLAWAVGIAVAAIAVRNAPERAQLDTALDGIIEPATALEPTTTEAPPRRTPSEPAGEGPCWPVYGRTPGRSSDAHELAHGRPLRRTWRLRVGIMEFPPSYCDGVLYVNSQQGLTWAVQASTRRVLWKRRTARLYDSTPAVAGSRIIVGSYSPPAVQALDRQTGRRLWKLSVGDAVESSPIVVDGLVYATSKDSRIYAIDERNGRVRWAFRTGAEVKNSPSVVGGRVYSADYAAQVFSLDARTGAIRWKRSLGGVIGDRIYSSVAIVGRRAYLATVRGDVYALDTRDGSTVWHESIPGYVYSTPAVSRSRLYIGNYQGTVYAFNARNGRQVWHRQLSGTISGSPSVLGRVVYVSGLSRRHTWGLDARTGRIVWDWPEGRYVSGIATDTALYLSLGAMLQRWSTAP